MRKIYGAMPKDGGILHCYDDSGDLQSVIVPAWLWKKIKHEAIRVLHEKGEIPAEPIDALEKFLEGWNAEGQPGWHDHYYQYKPTILCPVCKSETGNWRCQLPLPKVRSFWA